MSSDVLTAVKVLAKLFAVWFAGLIAFDVGGLVLLIYLVALAWYGWRLARRHLVFDRTLAWIVGSLVGFVIIVVITTGLSLGQHLMLAAVLLVISVIVANFRRAG